MGFGLQSNCGDTEEHIKYTDIKIDSVSLVPTKAAGNQGVMIDDHLTLSHQREYASLHFFSIFCPRGLKKQENIHFYRADMRGF